jgi:hypothetical protein
MAVGGTEAASIELLLLVRLQHAIHRVQAAQDQLAFPASGAPSRNR